jgi:hypothetical protein
MLAKPWKTKTQAIVQANPLRPRYTKLRAVNPPERAKPAPAVKRRERATAGLSGVRGDGVCRKNRAKVIWQRNLGDPARERTDRINSWEDITRRMTLVGDRRGP